MAFSLIVAVTLAALSRAAPTTVCPDGTHVSNSACCAFIPVGFMSCHGMFHESLTFSYQLAQDLQNTLFMNDCGEDGMSLLILFVAASPHISLAHEVIRLTFRMTSILFNTLGFTVDCSF